MCLGRRATAVCRAQIWGASVKRSGVDSLRLNHLYAKISSYLSISRLLSQDDDAFSGDLDLCLLRAV